MPLRVCHYADLLCRYDADMGLKNVSLCRYYAVMPHMCHYADFDAGIKRQPQELGGGERGSGTVALPLGNCIPLASDARNGRKHM